MVNTAIISEYNPFHKGHKYLIEEARRITGADYITVIMSGSFVQRAEPAVFSKEARAKMALESGADIVIELPCVNVLQSAERYAMGAVFVANSIKADYLAFGSECGDIDKIIKTAEAVTTDRVNSRLQDFLQSGSSFPAARAKAIELICPEIGDILSKPNNILGVEYVKALRTLNSDTIPVTVKRIGANHDDSQINNGFASATHIRKMLLEQKSTSEFVPEAVAKIINEEIAGGRCVLNKEFFNRAMLASLRTKDIQSISLATDCAEGLEYKIISGIQNHNSIDAITDEVKSKRYTHSRIRRILLSVFLGINKCDHTMPSYVRLLGLRKSASKAWNEIKEFCFLPVIERPAKQISYLDENVRQALEREMIFDEIWGSFCEKVMDFGENYRKYPVVL